MTNRVLNAEEALSIDTAFLERPLDITQLIRTQDVRIEEGMVMGSGTRPFEFRFDPRPCKRGTNAVQMMYA